ncbi:MAG TPA: hypothetical protein VGM19_02245 [Armatimonadota bacterium]|jgi:predicted outer membrane protein
MRHLLSSLLALSLLALLGCGAGKGPASTPEGTAQALLAAVRAGDASALAALYDYSVYAKSQNQDWDSIPKGQQDLIVSKLIEEKAGALGPALEQMKTDLAKVKVGKAEINGETATVPLEGGAAQPLKMMQRNGKWYLSD